MKSLMIEFWENIKIVFKLAIALFITLGIIFGPMIVISHFIKNQIWGALLLLGHLILLIFILTILKMRKII